MNEVVTKLLSELSKFSGREEGLRKIKRWSIRPTMFYRSSVFSHSKRVARMISNIGSLLTQTFGTDFDVKRTVILGLIHDDAELITGDHQAGNKANMTKEQLAAIGAEERKAVIQLARLFPPFVATYNYRELLEDVQDLKSKEARIAKFIDMMDAFGEGLHELYAGNTVLLERPKTEYGIAPRFDVLYRDRRQRFLKKYPEIQPLTQKHSLFAPLALYEWESFISSRSPHTAKSLREKVNHPQYDTWKEIVLSSGDSEEIENLYTQREFL
jgi:5'-deoxynucleotidase YfbR-like HD superfamily hydrolase